MSASAPGLKECRVAQAEQNMGVLYPRSLVMQQILSVTNFDALATAGDYSEPLTIGTRRGAQRCERSLWCSSCSDMLCRRRMAKSLLEHDRCLWALENDYTPRLCRMYPLEASPKNDIIVGWPRESTPTAAHMAALSCDLPCESICLPCEPPEAASSHPLTETEQRVQRIRAELQLEYRDDEIDALWEQLLVFKTDGPESITFAPGQHGKVQRRLIHAVAEGLELFHYSVGAKKSERYLVVTKVDMGVANGYNCSVAPVKRELVTIEQ